MEEKISESNRSCKLVSLIEEVLLIVLVHVSSVDCVREMWSF